jgi:hypothetical protein
VRPADQHRQVLDGEVLLAHPAEVHAVGFDAGEAGQREGGRFVGVPAVTAALEVGCECVLDGSAGVPVAVELGEYQRRRPVWRLVQAQPASPSAGKSPRG